MTIRLCLSICLILLLSSGALAGEQNPVPDRSSTKEGAVGAQKSETAEEVVNAKLGITRVSPIMYRGTRPDKEIFEFLKKIGVKSVISARTNPQKNRAKLANQYGIKFFHVHTGVFKVPGQFEIDKFFSLVNDPANQPVYVTCWAGEDRTSFYVSLYQIVYGDWSYEEAVEDMDKHDLKRWWYVFNDYEQVIKEYADKKAEANGTTKESARSADKSPADGLSQPGGPTMTEVAAPPDAGSQGRQSNPRT